MKSKVVILTAILLVLALTCGCGKDTQTPVTLRSSTTAPQGDMQDAEADIEPSQAAQMYADYLLNEGFRELLYDYDDPDAEFDVKACLADFNEDGVPELLLKTEEPTAMYVCVDVLLGVQNGKVVPMAYASYPGGSIGGDYLNIRYDTQAGKHVLETEEFARAGSHASTVSYYYYDCSRIGTNPVQFEMGSRSALFRTAHTLEAKTVAVEGALKENAEEIMRETDLYVLEGDYVTAYKYDGAFVPEAQYDELRAQYVEPTDPAYQLKPVTLQNPIPAN